MFVIYLLFKKVILNILTMKRTENIQELYEDIIII